MKLLKFLPHRISRLTEKLSRSAEFAKIGLENHDWDFGYVWKLLAFKLKRLHHGLETGCAIHEKEYMDALLETIAICERQAAERYETKYIELHDIKWGETQDSFTPNYDENGKVLSHRWEFSKEKANTPELVEQERQEFLKCFELAEKDEEADFERFVAILRKYRKAWWD